MIVTILPEPGLLGEAPRKAAEGRTAGRHTVFTGRGTSQRRSGSAASAVARGNDLLPGG
jgi:hypothetical protein